MNPADWPAIVGAMRAGGYYDRIMAGGEELDRVKDYLRAFAGQRDPAGSDPAMNPKYPCFARLAPQPIPRRRAIRAARLPSRKTGG